MSEDSTFAARHGPQQPVEVPSNTEAVQIVRGQGARRETSEASFPYAAVSDGERNAEIAHISKAVQGSGMPKLPPFRARSRLLALLAVAALAAGLALSCEDAAVPPLRGVADTTTHDWRFEIDTLGGFNSGIRDVVAFGRNDAWITGEIRIYPDPTDLGHYDLYNLAHWDGTKWTLQQVYVNPPPDYHSYIAGGDQLIGLSDHTIIMVASDMVRSDGNKWIHCELQLSAFPSGPTRMWVRNDREIYIGCSRGDITRWDGRAHNGKFELLHTPPTGLPIVDVSGDGDAIFACELNSSRSRSAILVNRGKPFVVFDSMRTDFILQASSATYLSKGDVLAVAGSGIRLFKDGAWYDPDPGVSIVPYCYTVRGTAANNIWFGGAFLFLAHYNGSTFRYFPRIRNGILKRIVVGEDYFFAVGFQILDNGEPRGVVIRGYRNG
jgi:hypothetical protein